MLETAATFALTQHNATYLAIGLALMLVGAMMIIVRYWWTETDYIIRVGFLQGENQQYKECTERLEKELSAANIELKATKDDLNSCLKSLSERLREEAVTQQLVKEIHALSGVALNPYKKSGAAPDARSDKRPTDDTSSPAAMATVPVVHDNGSTQLSSRMQSNNKPSSRYDDI